MRGGHTSLKAMKRGEHMVSQKLRATGHLVLLDVEHQLVHGNAAGYRCPHTTLDLGNDLCSHQQATGGDVPKRVNRVVVSLVGHSHRVHDAMMSGRAMRRIRKITDL